MFKDDGRHGVAVAVSDEPCTDTGGCDPSKETLCEFVLDTRNARYRHAFYDHNQNRPVYVDCKGATGKYVDS